MVAKLLDGKALAEKIRNDLAEKTADHLARVGRPPGLAAVLVGEDPASQLYVSKKHQACQDAGFHSELFQLSASIGQDDLLKKIRDLNRSDITDGILVQLPLPIGIDENAVLESVNPDKDVDGFHPLNQGKLMQGRPCFVAATPKGVMRLLAEYGIALATKRVVIVGRSNIVGKPLALLTLQQDATVTVCHSKTKNLPDITSQADVLVAAAGKAGLIGEEHIKKGAVVVDVGMTRQNGKLKGDVDFESVKEKASWITPVPGGVGPMTIAMLLENTFESYLKKNSK